MDVFQMIIIFVVLVLTVFLTATGFQFFKILQELTKTIQKINKIIDDAGIMSGTVAKSIASLSGMAAGLQSVLSLVGIFKKEKKDD